MSTCPVHQIPFKIVPAGVSAKTGRPYNAFPVCPVQGCDQKPPKANGGFLAAPQAQLEPRTGPSAPAPLPGASGGPGRAQNSPERDRLIVSQVAMKAAVELASSSRLAAETASLDDVFAMAGRIYLETFRLAAIDPNDPEGLGF